MDSVDDFIKFDFSEDDSEEEVDKLDKGILSVETLRPIAIPCWTPPSKKYPQNFIQFLNEEIYDFKQFVAPSEAEHGKGIVDEEMRKFTLNRLEHIINDLWPDTKLACFGSFDTKLYLPSSDLDCALLSPSLNIPSCFEELKQALESSQVGVSVEVPILKYVDSITRFPVDVSANMSNGIEAAKVVKRYLDDPLIGETARTLMLLLKQFLVQRNMNEVFSGGLGSYSLLCLIISFLKLHPEIQKGTIDPMRNIGILLIEFFELYGKAMNFNRISIALEGDYPYYFRREQQGRPTQISVVDPQDPTNDVSQGSFNFNGIKFAFMRAYMVLTSMIGAAREKYLERQIVDTSQKSRKMISLLGSILCLNRKVLEQRDYITDLYEKYVAGELVQDFFGVKGINSPAPNFKRKRKRHEEEDEQDIIFIDDSDAKSINSLESIDSDKGDITAFYKQKKL